MLQWVQKHTRWNLLHILAKIPPPPIPATLSCQSETRGSWPLDQLRLLTMPRLLLQHDCFETETGFFKQRLQTHLILVYLQAAAWDFCQGGEIYTESISVLTSTAKCNCCFMVPAHHTEHCVQDMNEQSISYPSASLCVIGLPGTLLWSIPIFIALKAIRLKKNPHSQPFLCRLFVKQSMAVLITMARQHQVWNESQFPWGSLCQKSAVERGFAEFSTW